MIQSGMVLDGIYRIIQEIGQGGTGIIYLAEHLRLHKKVVVKKIKDHFVGQVNGRAEVDILKRLHHSYLPQVYDFLVIGDSIYTVMEYIEGRDLQYYLDGKYTFPEESIRKWLLQLAQVLGYLHSQQPPILHSDIKPGNIMITGSGDVCLIDFNISLDGETSKDVQGISPWYAAPEQYERAQHVLYGQEDRIVLDGRMDIYSLGATFYRVMTGCLPSPTEDLSAMLPYMDIPYSDGLKAIVSRMIKPSPFRRYASAEKLQTALEDISKADPVYRRYGYAQMGVFFGWMLCVITGALCIYYGNWKNTVENWQKAYQQLYIAAESENEAEIIAEGTELLNDVSYRSYLKKNTKKKAEVLNILGDSYFRQELYNEAASYYNEAWELENTETRYCENYVLALIRSGETDKAGAVVNSAEGSRLLSQEKKELIALEILWVSGETENAQDELEKFAQSAMQEADNNMVVNACQLLADIYQEKSAYADAISVLENALSIKEEQNLRRQLGEICFLAAQASDREVYQNSYLSKALENYEILNQSSDPGFEDELNLALVKRALGKYESSNRTLKEMLVKYPEQYAVSMWMCYNYLDIAKEEGSYQDVRSDLNFRYQDCKHIYDSGEKRDENMENLKAIMNELEE
jgi:tRNA A-37 threonylcarbamoyl transferase component Bud32/Flp pilus assembly protein TadD